MPNTPQHPLSWHIARFVSADPLTPPADTGEVKRAPLDVLLREMHERAQRLATELVAEYGGVPLTVIGLAPCDVHGIDVVAFPWQGEELQSPDMFFDQVRKTCRGHGVIAATTLLTADRLPDDGQGYKGEAVRVLTERPMVDGTDLGAPMALVWQAEQPPAAPSSPQHPRPARSWGLHLFEISYLPTATQRADWIEEAPVAEHPGILYPGAAGTSMGGLPC